MTTNNPSRLSVSPQSVVALTWTLRDGCGELLDELEEPVEFYVGGKDLLPAIEQALIGKTAPEEIQLQLEPGQAFGDYDETRLFLEKRALFPNDLEEGQIIAASALPAACVAQSSNAPSAREGDAHFIVSSIYPDHVVLDGNHPLAGIGLQLSLQLHAVREAQSQEAETGSAGPGFFRLGQ